MKPSKTEKMIISRVTAALRLNRPVTVDGTRIQGIRFSDGELEVNWYGLEEPLWTVIQPCFLSGVADEVSDNRLELNTY